MTDKFNIAFEWTFIKDKEIQLHGNEEGGVIYVLDENDNILEAYFYEKVKRENTEGAGDNP